ncbi:unnamed protein product [Leptidea sinapis]|uniref:Lipase domain-containing protein n=1 Tax=Leptidea sinapis TaxID=189913 RepID=A0A5E4R4C6_9NEOP|nr:unnamed protein product [Leptidea sinapis]
MFNVICLVVIIIVGNTRVYAVTCVEPPLKCPNENISFWLYTRANQNNPQEINVSDSKSLLDAPWVLDAPIKVLIHGYTGYRDFSPNTEIRPVYLECCNYNIISLDYNKLALEGCYIEAVYNTQLVGMCTAQLIDHLVDLGLRLKDFHVIGFSLGAHVAGMIANYLKSGQLERITALDPALPLFATAAKNSKVDAGDAKFVDGLHTNILEKGKLETSGLIDFYANAKSGCNHARAPQYYAESIITTTGFYGVKCYSWIAYTLGLCRLIPDDVEVLFGEYVPRK